MTPTKKNDMPPSSFSSMSSDSTRTQPQFKFEFVFHFLRVVLFTPAILKCVGKYETYGWPETEYRKNLRTRNFKWNLIVLDRLVNVYVNQISISRECVNGW